MVSSYSRGHLIIYEGDKWLYADTKEIYDDSRPCKKCEEYPTKEGYDACIGYIKGAKFACCGHGAIEPYVLKEQMADAKWLDIKPNSENKHAVNAVEKFKEFLNVRE